MYQKCSATHETSFFCKIVPSCMLLFQFVLNMPGLQVKSSSWISDLFPHPCAIFWHTVRLLRHYKPLSIRVEVSIGANNKPVKQYHTKKLSRDEVSNVPATAHQLIPLTVSHCQSCNIQFKFLLLNVHLLMKDRSLLNIRITNYWSLTIICPSCSGSEV
jgi:hypothetical protein